MPLPGGGGQSGAVRAGGAFVEIFVKDNITKHLDRIAARFKKFGATLAKIGGVGIGLGAGLLGPLAGLFKGGLDFAGDLQDLQDEFGLSAESVSKLGTAFKVLGVEAEPVLKGLSEANKTGLPLDQFALAFADELANIDDGSERFQRAVEVLGKAGGKFARIAGDLREEMGRSGIIDQTTLDNADNFGKSIERIKLAAVTALLPFAQYAAKAAEAIAGLVSRNQQLFRVLAAVGAGLVAGGIAFVAVGAAAAAFGHILSTVGVAFAFMVSPAGILVLKLAMIAAGFAAAGYALYRFGGLGRETLAGMAERWGDTFGRILTAAKTTFDGISDALMGGDFQLAWEIAKAGVEVIWENLWAQLKFTWQKFKQGFVDGWADLGDGVALVFNDAIAGVKTAFTDFEAFVFRIMNGILRTVIKTVTSMMEFIDHWFLKPLETGQAHFGMDGPLKAIREGLRGGINAAEGLVPSDKSINAIRDRREKEIEAERAGIEQIGQDRINKRAGGRGDIRPDMAAADEAQRRLDKLREQARPWEGGGIDLRNDALKLAVGAAKGATQIGSGRLAAQMFGAGESGIKQLVKIGEQQLKVLEKIEEQGGAAGGTFE